ncbi:aldo/keto reductase [Pseudoclavibacter sp. RFBJ3]|nr:aldo/keto reductase [Pseudoclavibacter sp. RFBJ5]PPF90415.1 aldo/keto reductase [Pseudoclavibacter sp. RFBJ3]PPG01137.1 aldo/keto reductase [Pseudoclavibacter sp. RFBH5]PPG17639.1 aldo/keto reductase [Pseudoclavibacter sp. RFBI4]
MGPARDASAETETQARSSAFLGRRVGQTNVHVSRIGFGAASLGNLYRETSEEEAAGAVEAAWDAGIRYFDTAPHYGLGLSERRLGAALAAYPRDELVISTKIGRLLVPNPEPSGLDDGFVVPDTLMRHWDFSRDGVLRSLEGSLERLGTDRIDIAFVHDPDAFSEGAAREALVTLRELRDEGVVGAIGVGTNETSQLGSLFDERLIDVAMLAGRYTLLEQPGLESVLEPARRAGASVIAVGVYNSGLLSTPRPGPDAVYNYLPVPPAALERVHRIADICERHGVTLPDAALAFPLQHPAVAGIALGMRTAGQVRDNLRRASVAVPDALWPDLERHGLIDPRSIRLTA